MIAIPATAPVPDRLLHHLQRDSELSGRAYVLSYHRLLRRSSTQAPRIARGIGVIDTRTRRKGPCGPFRARSIGYPILSPTYS
jgi:hypothetical protein